MFDIKKDKNEMKVIGWEEKTEIENEEEIEEEYILELIEDDETEFELNKEKIKVIGVGGAGGNAINTMMKEIIEKGIRDENVEYIAMNTDVGDLQKSKSCAQKRFKLGPKTAKGRGAGSNPKIGKAAAEESENGIKNLLKDTDMIFLTGGMGGGTGTGALPVIARIAKELQILTVAIVSTPFTTTSEKRKKIAEAGIEELEKTVDTLIVISNDKLMEICPGNSMDDAFDYGNKILKDFVNSVISIINTTGYINIDFADIKNLLSNRGRTHIGVGRAEGEGRGLKALKAAIDNSLLDTDIKGAGSSLIFVCTSDSLPQLEEYNQILTEAHKSINNIENQDKDGAAIVEGLGKDILVTIIATGVKEIEKKNSSLVEEKERTETLEEESDEPLVFAIPEWVNKEK